MEGTRVAGFTVERTLGAGGMATVYLARQDGSPAPVALKLMHPHLAGSPQLVQRFQREIAASAELSHPNIVKVLACGEDAGRFFIASEFVDGGALDGLLAREKGALPAVVAAQLARQLFLGLQYAHGRGLVHRDVKPANLLLTRAGALKIADFGIAKSRDATTLTATGGVLGTPAYMSPEQAAGRPVDARSDLFSAGVVLYELLTGVNPFIAETPSATMVKILRSDAPLVGERPSVPPELGRLAERLLQRDPDQRFASGTEVVAALDAWFASVGVRGYEVLTAFLRDPAATRPRITEYFLARGRQSVQALLAAGDAASRARATLELLRLLHLAPQDAQLNATLATLSAQAPLSLAAPRNPKIAELEAAAADSPDAVGLWVQLASLYRLEGNVLRAVLCFRKALRRRPHDGYLAGQLEALTGERQEVLPAPPGGTRAPATGLAHTVLSHKTQVDDELHTGRTGEVRPRPPTSAFSVPAELLPAEPPPAPPLPLAYAIAFWRGGGKPVLLVLGVVLVLVLGVRRASRSIDTATVEAGKSTEVALKAAEARAQAMVGQKLAAADEAAARRLGESGSLDLDHALALSAQGRHDEAAEALAGVVQQNPGRPLASRAQLARGNVLLAAGRTDAAIAEFAALADRKPAAAESEEARVRLAEALLSAQRFREAAEAATSAATPPHEDRARLVRARARLELAERDLAREDAEWLRDHLASSDPRRPQVIDLLVRAGGTPPPPPPRAQDDDPRMRGVE